MKLPIYDLIINQDENNDVIAYGNNTLHVQRFHLIMMIL